MILLQARLPFEPVAPALIPLKGFLINLGITAFLAVLLGVLYVRFGRTLSDRRALARNFVLLSMTTMVIITVVKASLALSLGLVGALSIVRFRTAIKEPEELAYLFVAIAIGLGLGADQREVTCLAFVVLSLAIVVLSLGGRRTRTENMILTVAAGAEASVRDVVTLLERHCHALTLQRYDENEQGMEASFRVAFSSFDEFVNAREVLSREHPGVHITLLDSSGLA